MITRACRQRLFHYSNSYDLKSQLRFASSLVIAEHNNKSMNLSTLSVISAAHKLGGEVSILVLGHDSNSVVEEAIKIPGISKVLHANHPIYKNWVAENVSLGIKQATESEAFSHIFALSSMCGKNYIGRLAAQMDVSPITDIVKVIDENTFERPMYAGNAISTVSAFDPVKLITVRATAFDKALNTGGSAAVKEASLPNEPNAKLSEFVSESICHSERPDLSTARVVVSGGRGMKSKENFQMLEKLADKLGGAVGASRAAVDAGYVPNEMQIGQTGKVVAPELYFAIGISGAIQHLSGMKDSKCIVAINKDMDAPIFSVADYGLAIDLFNALPELCKKV